MLAIAAPSFHQPSETFIREHVRTIAPGQTVLLCRDGRGTEGLGCPVLTDVNVWPEPETWLDGAKDRLRRQWRLIMHPELMPRDHDRVVAFLRQHRVRTLLAEFAPAGLLYPRACAEAGVKLFVHVHGFDIHVQGRKIRVRRAYRKLFDQAHGVVAACSSMKAQLLRLGCPEEKISVVPLGVDPARFEPGDRDPLRVVAVGRLVDKKAPHLTIRAFAEVARELSGARLDVIGDGPLMGRCRELIRELGLGGKVQLHGAKGSDEIAQAMSKASVFVQHSVTAPSGDQEGFGITPVEAMAAALPVVVTRHGGFVETVVEGETGLFVDEHDVPGMARAMASLLRDPARARAMGEAGRRRVLERYTLQGSARHLRAVLGLGDAAESPVPAAGGTGQLSLSDPK